MTIFDESALGLALRATFSFDLGCVSCNIPARRNQRRVAMRDFLELQRRHFIRSLVEAAVMSGFILALALWLPEIVR
jgi:hypothetical protein